MIGKSYLFVFITVFYLFSAHPTPKYNNSILTNILLEKHLGLLYDAMNECEKMADAAVLFKVWLHQRFFSEVI